MILRMLAKALLCAFLCTTQLMANDQQCSKPGIGERIQFGKNYPYARPFSESPFSFLYVNGKAYRYRSYGNGASDYLTSAEVEVNGKVMRVDALLKKQFGKKSTQIATMSQRQPILAYGSNPTLVALNDKYCESMQSEPVVLPVIEGRLKDFDVVHAAHLVANGMPPATIAYSPGTTVQVYMQYFTPQEIEVMDVSEGVGRIYSRSRLNDIQLILESGEKMDSLQVYLDCDHALSLDDEIFSYAAIPAEGRRFTGVTSEELVDSLMLELDFEESKNCFIAQNVLGRQCRLNRSLAMRELKQVLNPPSFKALPGKACKEMPLGKPIMGACGRCPG